MHRLSLEAAPLARVEQAHLCLTPRFCYCFLVPFGDAHHSRMSGSSCATPQVHQKLPQPAMCCLASA